jgi:hypothetical protein
MTKETQQEPQETQLHYSSFEYTIIHLLLEIRGELQQLNNNQTKEEINEVKI